MLTTFYVSGQYSMEVKGGVFFANLIKSPENFTKSFDGWGLKSEVTILRNLVSKENNQLRIGAGYTIFKFLDENLLFVNDRNNSLSRSYANIILRYERNIYKDKIYLQGSVSNYILLHKIDNEFSLQNGIFTNIDLGVRIPLNQKVSIVLTSPITIFPMLSGRTQVGAVSSDPFIDLFVEQIGGDLGVYYDFKYPRTYKIKKR